MTDDLARTARRTAERAALLPDGSRVLVSWSGGPDSTALLLWLREQAADMGLEVGAFHFDHGAREASGADAAWCEAEAARLDLPLAVARAEGEPEGAGPEDAWRQARHAALERARAKGGWHLSALGHTLDDAVETLLLRVGRGAGLEGVKGIPLRRGPLVRPLLECTRQQVEEFLEARGRETLDDPANRDPRHPRARLRSAVTPALRGAWGDRWPTGPRRAMRHLAEADAALGAVAADTLRVCRQGDALSLRALDLPPGLAKRVLALWLRGLGVEAPRGGLERVAALATAADGTVAEGPPWFRVARRSGSLCWEGDPGGQT